MQSIRAAGEISGCLRMGGRKMKRMIQVLAVLVLLLGMLIPMSAMAAGNPVPKAKQAVVQVTSGIYYDASGSVRTYNGYYSGGTAFGVYAENGGALVFATNGHVVSDDDGKAYDFVYVCIDGADIRDESTMIKCDVIYVDNSIDVAIIKAPEPVKGVGVLPLMPAEELETGNDVYALGFPGIADKVSDSNNYTVEDITVTDGIISRYLTNAGVKCMAHTATVNHGNSGGPLINEYGHAIGINTFIYVDKSTADLRSYAIYSDYVMEALDQLGIPYDLRTMDNLEGNIPSTVPQTQPAANEEESQPAQTEQAPATQAAEPQTTEPQTVETQPKKEEERSNLPVIFLGAAALLVAAGVVTVLVIRKKPAAPQVQNAAHTFQPQTPVAPTQFPLNVYAVSGPLAGQSWQLGNVMTIGRDHGCTVVYPPDASGVSRNHCRIDRRGPEVLVTDLGSSYGTYIAGRKLPPNTPVRIGPNQEIWLGGSQNRLVIR